MRGLRGGEASGESPIVHDDFDGERVMPADRRRVLPRDSRRGCAPLGPVILCAHWALVSRIWGEGMVGGVYRQKRLWAAVACIARWFRRSSAIGCMCIPGTRADET